jgi:hypothetical protein
MERHATLHEARAALDTIERGRLTVVAEIDLPRWYWAGLALGWIGLGFVADLGYGWVRSPPRSPSAPSTRPSPGACSAAATAPSSSASARMSPDGRHRGS